MVNAGYQLLIDFIHSKWIGMSPLDIAPPVETVGLSAVAIGGLCCGVVVVIGIAVAVVLTIRKKTKSEKEDPS